MILISFERIFSNYRSPRPHSKLMMLINVIKWSVLILTCFLLMLFNIAKIINLLHNYCMSVVGLTKVYIEEDIIRIVWLFNELNHVKPLISYHDWMCYNNVIYNILLHFRISMNILLFIDKLVKGDFTNLSTIKSWYNE
jgi:hypothetical protein